MKVNKRILAMIIGTLMIGSMVVGCEKKENQVIPTVQVTDKEEPVKEEKKEEVNEVIYDESDVKITYKGVEKNKVIFTTDYKFKIENNSDKDIQVQSESISINDSMIDEYIVSTVLSGKNATTELMIEEDTLKDNEIEKIEKMEIALLLMDNETYKVIDRKNITLDFSK